MWKFYVYTITQILREINFRDSRSAQSTIATHLQALNFFFQFLHFLKAEISQMNRFQSPLKLQKKAILDLPDSPKSISRKILMREIPEISTP